MSDICYDLHGVRLMRCEAVGRRIRSDRDAVELIAVASQHGAELIVIPAERLGDDFFQLKTGKAGEILQKFLTYHLRVVIVGDISSHLNESSALRGFVLESNLGPDVWFLANADDLNQRLQHRNDL